ncbi:hypothetical protein V9T40_006628 [Parthenolecanium corni]|uniref:1-alkyl-2-acetylglycerophosphocholine esterase n=1 Tax=Parthenolecanium corni TaxID=536013 RepID=A0AAN9U067_9HEMI
MFHWWRKKTGTLPFPEGPYVTGCVEIMNDYSKDSLFVRLLYPTDVHPTDLQKHSKRWVPWVIHEKYMEAFAALLTLWLFILKLILFLVGKIYIPTLWEEPVTTEKKKLPVVVFSHGYGATRFLCSTVCNELASRGFLVAALEHKDLSASITYYYKSENDRDEDNKSYLMHIPFDIDVKEHYSTRNKQLKKRVDECKRLIDFLDDINNGNGRNILKSNFDLDSLRGRLDLSEPIIMGHSFGGATAMYALATEPRFKLGVILDGWMFPLKQEQIEIHKPMLFVNTHTFHLEANIKLMKNFTNLPQNELYTMRNTTHESSTDTPQVFGYWLNLFMKKLDSRIALKIQNYLILQFLQKHTGLEIEEDLVKNYLKLRENDLTNDYILFAKKALRKFTLF